MSDHERRDPVSLRKNEREQPVDFDPYRFGAPEHPVPPEYAPPGYRPPSPTQQPHNQPPGAQPPHTPPPWQPYGAPPPPPQYWPQYPQPRTGNGKAIAALVLGIVSIVLCWLSLLDVVPVVLALVFGFLGRHDSVRDPARGGRGMAVAGIACAVVGALLAGLFTAWAIHRLQPCYQHFDGSSAQYRTCIQQRF